MASGFSTKFSPTKQPTGKQQCQLEHDLDHDPGYEKKISFFFSRNIELGLVEPTDFECPLCFRLLWQPITTPCGHTFCKMCLDRVLDHNIECPMCKSATLKSYLTDRRETMVNEFVESTMMRMIPKEYIERKRVNDEEIKVLKI